MFHLLAQASAMDSELVAFGGGAQTTGCEAVQPSIAAGALRAGVYPRKKCWCVHVCFAQASARDAELVALRHALTSSFEERRELAAQLEKAQARAAAAAAAGGSGGGGGSQHLPRGSPHSASASPPGGSPSHHHQQQQQQQQQQHAHAHSHAGPGKPYRAGLISRPKFKA